MKKFIFVVFLILGFVLVPASYSSVYAITNSISDSEARSDDIGYRYKFIDGILHKRLYNYSKHVWIGDWIPA